MSGRFKSEVHAIRWLRVAGSHLAGELLQLIILGV